MIKKRIRLSTAIRKGINRFPEQITQAYFKVNRACALGCAIYTVYGVPDESLIDELVDDFPELHQDEYHIKPTGEVQHKLNTDNLKDVIVSLNDDFGWTREQIADWLESEGL